MVCTIYPCSRSLSLLPKKSLAFERQEQAHWHAAAENRFKTFIVELVFYAKNSVKSFQWKVFLWFRVYIRAYRIR